MLVAYNQERFIGDAVRGALSQDYPNLRIVVSDDASPDGTFREIQRAVSGYRGPHQLEVRRNERNLGLIGHVQKLVSEIGTDKVVAAAGDDIANPDRVTATMAAWRESPAADIVVSAANVIDGDGRPLYTQRFGGKGLVDRTSRLESRIICYSDLVLGANAAFKRSLYMDFPPIRAGAAEDHVIGIRALIGGGILFVDRPLLQYRVHDSNMFSQNAGDGGIPSDDVLRRRMRIGIASVEQHIEDIELAKGRGLIPTETARELTVLLTAQRALLELRLVTDRDCAAAVSHLMLEEWLSLRSAVADGSRWLSGPGAQGLRLIRGLVRRWRQRELGWF